MPLRESYVGKLYGLPLVSIRYIRFANISSRGNVFLVDSLEITNRKPGVFYSY